MRDIKNLEIAGKRVLVRVDLNVPVHHGNILDFSRIDLISKTVKFLHEKSAKIVLISHFGRPDGMYNPELSLEFIVPTLAKRLNIDVSFGGRLTDAEAVEKTKALQDGSIILFENLRFHREEELNDSNFAKHLSSFGDYYVNEAFSCSHRAHASIDAITNYLPAYPGFSLLEDIGALEMVLHTKGKRVVAIIGGKKVSTKFPLLENLATVCSKIIIGGAMANTFYAARGFMMGESFYETSILAAVEDFDCQHSDKIILPDDFKCLNKESLISTYHFTEIPSDNTALDVGEESVMKFKEVIKLADIVLWNGPLGYYENANFNKATIELAEYISSLTADNKTKSVVGGGDTIAAISKANNAVFSYVSTAGGAFLEYCEGKDLPGVLALKRERKRK
ncbi:MAG: phosphoglycerate kinase [Candidatus Jidaibacter sp.]|nr:phosphoglycerate kinase [Candidatus Jidaibacter sp.]